MFGISVSGIKNSQKHIDVTSNNIANANSYGFKKSRAEFADVYANSVFSNSKTAAGMGVQNSVVSQQFVQGALSGDTGNALDMAIQGNGFFVLSPNGGTGGNTFTRNGAFQVNNEGYIVTATNDYLLGWDVNPDGTSTSLDLNAAHGIKVPTDTGAPKPTGNAGIGVNLPADKPNLEFPTLEQDPVNNAAWPENFNPQYGIPRNTDGSIATGEDANPAFMQYYTNFDPKDPSTYTSSTSQTIHDSLGREHTLTYYIMKVGPEGEGSNNTVWNVIPYVDGKPVDIRSQGTTADQNPIMMSVPSDSTSSVAGANFFGFQLKFDPSGELLPNGQIPGKLEFVNLDGNQGLIGSLRQQLFGVPGEEAGSGAWDGLGGATNGQFIDRTFESLIDNTDPENPTTKPPYYANANGTLHTAMGAGIDPTQNINLSFKATQYGSSNFNVTEAPTNDGYATGILLSMNVDDNGILQAEFSNGQRINIAKIALADFTNPQGLTKIGNSQWKASIDSGQPIAKEANTGSAGAIKGANLELSNVDLTTELVELITAQRNYQANAQALQTNSTVMDSILNIR